MKVVERALAGRSFSIEVGRVAKQAGGAALVRYGDSVVLVTATAANSAREDVDFLPLTVDYQEKTFAAGKIPGGFFKREGRLGEREILTSRLIDRPHRPLFPKGWNCETQIVATVLSAEKDADPDVVAVTGASAALTVSDIPFDGPIAALRIGRVDGKFVINPTHAELETSDINLIVAGSRDALMMVEGGADEVPDAVMLDALFTAHEALQPLIDMQEELQKAVGKKKREVRAEASLAGLEERVRATATPLLAAALREPVKHERAARFDEAKAQTVTALEAEFPGQERALASAFSHVKYEAVRQMIVRDKVRLDGRDHRTVRPISGDVGLLPRAHGSALFTRGETQALVATTLGTQADRTARRRSSGREPQALHAALQLPALQRGRGQVPARPEPSRHRSRSARRARAATRASRSRRLPLHDPDRLGDPRVERLFFDGDRMRRRAFAPRCGSARSSPRSPASRWG